jgi:GNAT superfamily N-acetyltransferase
MSDLPAIEPFDPRTAVGADLEACLAVRVASHARDLPGDPAPTLDDLVASLTATSSEQRTVLWVARAGGTIVGLGYLMLPTVVNVDLGMFWAWVHPAHRRRGFGTALLATAVGLLRDEGRDTMFVEPVEGTDSVGFAERYGFEVGQREVLSRLDMSTVDADRLAAVIATDRPGYRLLSWAGPIPAEHLERYATAANAMLDAPVGDLRFEPPTYTPARVRDWESWADQRGRDVLITVAVHEPTGDFAGVTVLMLPRQVTGRAHQDDTTVVRAHRGHGLGLWIKAEMAHRLLTEHPEIHEVITGNAEENSHMRRINTDLGFAPYRVIEERQARVADVAKQLGL